MYIPVHTNIYFKELAVIISNVLLYIHSLVFSFLLYTPREIPYANCVPFFFFIHITTTCIPSQENAIYTYKYISIFIYRKTLSHKSYGKK